MSFLFGALDVLTSPLPQGGHWPPTKIDPPSRHPRARGRRRKLQRRKLQRHCVAAHRRWKHGDHHSGIPRRQRLIFTIIDHRRLLFAAGTSRCGRTGCRKTSPDSKSNNGADDKRQHQREDNVLEFQLGRRLAPSCV